MTEAKHTELPWEVHDHTHAYGEFWATIGHDGRGPITDIIGEEGSYTRHWQPVAGVKYLVTPVAEQKANLEFIVRACNSHYALVEALEELTEALNNVHVSGLDHELEQLSYADSKARAALKTSKR